MSILNVNKNNFEQIRNSDKPVLLDFYADWCGPCRMVSPLVEQIAEENPQYLVGKINVDSEPELAQAFGVASIIYTRRHPERTNVGLPERCRFT